MTLEIDKAARCPICRAPMYSAQTAGGCERWHESGSKPCREAARIAALDIADFIPATKNAQRLQGAQTLRPKGQAKAMNQESEENKEQVDRDLSGLVRQVARRYARRCWWAEEAELAQVAWTAALQARALFEPEKAPNGIKPFARLRVERTVSRFLLANSSPVSASDHARYDLIGIQRESLAIMRLGTAAHDNPADWKRDRPELTDHRTPEQALVEERWRARVRARVVALAGSHAADLLDARRPAGSAERAQAYAALRALHEDEELRALWRSR